MITNTCVSVFFLRDVRLYILKFVHYTHIDLYNVLCNTNFEKFRNFVTLFNERLYIQCLVQGNMTQEAVIKNVQQYIEIISCKSLLPSMMPQIRVTQIPLGTQYCKVKNIDKTDVNSVVTNHYQTGIKSIELSVLIDLLMVSGLVSSFYWLYLGHIVSLISILIFICVPHIYILIFKS